jgi:hypothetical protein
LPHAVDQYTPDGGCRSGTSSGREEPGDPRVPRTPPGDGDRCRSPRSVEGWRGVTPPRQPSIHPKPEGGPRRRGVWGAMHVPPALRRP